MGLTYFFFAVTLAWSEYRVFLLEITDTTKVGTSTASQPAPATPGNEQKPSTPNGPRRVISTLDEIQYPDYYPLKPTEKIAYLDSWMCWGRTDEFKPPCAKPAPRQPAAAPSPETKSTPPPKAQP